MCTLAINSLRSNLRVTAVDNRAQEGMAKICPLPKDNYMYKGDAMFSCEADGYWMLCTCFINALWLTAVLFSSWRNGRVDEVRGSIFLHPRYWSHSTTIHCVHVCILLVVGALVIYISEACASIYFPAHQVHILITAVRACALL